MSSRNAPPPSIKSSQLWGGVLRDNTKNGCEADYTCHSKGSTFWVLFWPKFEPVAYCSADWCLSSWANWVILRQLAVKTAIAPCSSLTKYFEQHFSIYKLINKNDYVEHNYMLITYTSYKQDTNCIFTSTGDINSNSTCLFSDWQDVLWLVIFIMYLSLS